MMHLLALKKAPLFLWEKHVSHMSHESDWSEAVGPESQWY